MNQTCKVCGEPAAGFHFGAFTCEGCKSFFGRSYNNLSSISECKNNGKCIIDKKNRTTCKACRLRKCYTVGMSKGGSRYGRRSNWFKIHCLLQEQQQQAVEAAGKAAAAVAAAGNSPTAAHGFGDMAAAAAAAAAAQQHLQQQQQQQHQQQRNPHMAQHMGSLLGYPTYLPEMASAPFMSAARHHPADAAAAAALPFFSMMNSLPSIGSPQSAFQLPPHLLFPGYHHSAAAAAAAADAAYRSEIYKHRQSVDSAASIDSQRYTPPSARTHSRNTAEERVSSSPEVCVADEVHQSVHTSPHTVANVTTHTIHNPIAIRATPANLQQQQLKPHSPVQATAAVAPATGSPHIIETHTTESVAINVASPAASEPLTFNAKMQSLSPVSVCSISAETTTALTTVDQDCPMDLSMKTSRSSVHSFNTSAGESDVHSDSSSSEELEARQHARRKFYQLNESETSSTSSISDSEAVKRQKLAMDEANFGAAAHGFAHNANAMRGIFVCV